MKAAISFILFVSINLISAVSHSGGFDGQIGQFSFTEKGCYKDQRGQDSFQSDEMTVEMCVKGCGEKGYTVAALQYSSHCFCGAKQKDFIVVGKSERCDMPCAGNKKQNCGGSYANRVFFISTADRSNNGGTAIILPASPTAQNTSKQVFGVLGNEQTIYMDQERKNFEVVKSLFVSLLPTIVNEEDLTKDYATIFSVLSTIDEIYKTRAPNGTWPNNDAQKDLKENMYLLATFYAQAIKPGSPVDRAIDTILADAIKNSTRVLLTSKGSIIDAYGWKFNTENFLIERKGISLTQPMAKGILIQLDLLEGVNSANRGGLSESPANLNKAEVELFASFRKQINKMNADQNDPKLRYNGDSDVHVDFPGREIIRLFDDNPQVFEQIEQRVSQNSHKHIRSAVSFIRAYVMGMKQAKGML